jgi:hypothetical protein
MPRGVELSTVRTLLKSLIREVQLTLSDTDTELNNHLATAQSDLCAAHDWPFMEDKWESTVAAGSRYVALPTSNIRAIASAINFEKHVCVSRYFNSRYEPLDYGISIEQMNCHNSALSEAMDPIQRWQLDTNTGDSSNADQFEVWPMPVTEQKVRFEGQRAVRAFAVDADKSDLDSNLVALFAAADILAIRGHDNAALMLARAQRRLIVCRSGLPVKTPPVVLGANLSPQPRLRRVSVVAIAS